MNGQCGRFLAFAVIFAIVSVLSYLSKKKKREQEAEAREEFLRGEPEPAPPPESSAATGLEAFLQQLAGKARKEPEEAPSETPARQVAVWEERPREAPAVRAGPERAPVREIAPGAARSVERAGREDRRGPSPFERRRREIERQIAEAKREAEEAAARVRDAEKEVALAAAAATEAGAETPGLPAVALARSKLNRQNLRRAIVMMEILGRPRGLRGYEPH